MVDAADLKSATRNGVWVRLPPSAPLTPDSQARGFFYKPCDDLVVINSI